jgi:hypothetical protein
MGPEASRQYIELVREEAGARHKGRDQDLSEFQRRRETILALARTAALESPDLTEPQSDDPEKLVQLLKKDMVGMFELLLTAPQNDNFKAKAKPDKIGFNRYRHLTVADFGYMEVAGMEEAIALTEGKNAHYRLAVVGLPPVYSLENSPVLADLELNADEYDIDSLKDQRGTLRTVCEAAGIVEQEPDS